MQRRLVWNTSLSAVQVVVNALAMILLYRLVYEWLGSAVGGVWGVVLAWTSAAGIASMGLAGGVTKFVAQYDARGDAARAARLVETAVVTVGVVLAPVLATIYPLLGWLLRRIYTGEPTLMVAALEILPYALVSFWLASVALVILSGLDGLQRVTVRNVLVMGAALGLLALAWWRVPQAGLVGLAQAQLGQNALLLAGAWLMLHRLMPSLRPIPVRWRWPDLREMLGYGVGAQAIGLAQMLFEPVTKGLLAAFNPASVFFFDMAHKLVAQSRAVVATAHAALVPTLAAWHEQDAGRLRAFYVTSCRVMLLVVSIGWPVLIGVAPYVSVLWLGTYEQIFVVFLVLLSTGWTLNLLINPAYFDNMGTGRLRANVVGHAIIGLLNASLGWLMGWWLGPVGVAVAFVVALLCGSAFILRQYERTHGLSPRAWLEAHTLRLLMLNGVIAAGLSLVWYGVPGAAGWWLFPLGVLWGGLLIPMLMRHPLLHTLSASVPKPSSSP